MSMNPSMTEDERLAYLAAPRIGVISIEQPSAPPLTVPIWYGFDPDQGVWIVTGKDSLKAKRLDSAGRYSLVVQDEGRPHKYVSVEGPVVEVRTCTEDDIRPLAERYVDAAEVESYVKFTTEYASLIYVMKPEKWRTFDQTRAAI